LTIWFWHFSLPWQGLKAATKKEKYDNICDKKLSTPIEVYPGFQFHQTVEFPSPVQFSVFFYTEPHTVAHFG